MKTQETKLKGCYILEPTVFEDERGYFLETYNQNKLEQILGYKPVFVQDNESKSSYGVVRGLHMQAGVHAQAKLVRVVEGTVLDVVVDVRPNSPTFGVSFSVELSAVNKRQLFIPRGFLHGFSVLSETAIFSYKCDNGYNKEAEVGVYPLDENLDIAWGIPTARILLSEKDQKAQTFAEFHLKNK